ncbi:hypothetical protein Goshw_021487 [Gossypium schwendimanii]|uniref:Uncharacterized protein n=1 Tax=Gossypium schwendimanii TaxID=34291 RepID=A0A7J9L5S4_GOSSC|nr:hypothetical protein [Gossypium schwendimanii]
MASSDAVTTIDGDDNIGRPNPNILLTDQKPTPDQLVRIDSECLSSIVSNDPGKNDAKSAKTLQNQHLHQHHYQKQSFETSGSVSLTLGLQQHGGTGVSLAFSPAAQSSIFYPRDHIEDCQPVQYSLLDGEAQHLPYRSLIGAQLLHDFTALDVIIEIEWKGSGLIIVEIRSLVAYNWLLNKDRRPWSQQTTSVDMERRLACVGEVAFSKAEQHGNEMA